MHSDTNCIPENQCSTFCSHLAQVYSVTGVRHRQLNIDSGRFAIRAPAEIWEEFWRPMPKREHHDLFSMMAAGLAQIDGDLLPFMQNLQYFKDLLGALRPASIGN